MDANGVKSELLIISSVEGTFVPAIVAAEGDKASERFFTFFIDTIRNRNTRAAWYRNACRFMAWAEQRSLALGIHSWALPSCHKFIRYDAPQGRRVNALAAYRPLGRTPRLQRPLADGTWRAHDLLGYLRALPWSRVPRVVVLDNAGFHSGKVVRRARAGLAAGGIYLYYLPPYSPELNRIEGGFREVKHREIPYRSHTTRAGLREAVTRGFISYRRRLRPNTSRKLRPAA